MPLVRWLRSRYAAMQRPNRAVFLFDVDNTLLDNDRILSDLREYLTRELGQDCAREYFEQLEFLRDTTGYADYLGALQRYRALHPRDQRILTTSSFLADYPFAARLYPGALEAVEHTGRFGLTVVLSDGDVVFQPRKVDRSGLWSAVGGRVLIYIHKERELADVEARFPADRYVLVDDKVRILSAVKEAWGPRVTTVFPRQGHYAHAPEVTTYPPPDVTIDAVAQLAHRDWSELVDR